MSRGILWAGSLVLGISLAGLNCLAAEVVKFASGVKTAANYYLPLTAEKLSGDDSRSWFWIEALFKSGLPN